jgi:hypothetical protein
MIPFYKMDSNSNMKFSYQIGVMEFFLTFKVDDNIFSMGNVDFYSLPLIILIFLIALYNAPSIVGLVMAGNM